MKTVITFKSHQEKAKWAKEHLDNEYRLGRFVSITFVKKDGTDRHFIVKKSKSLEVKGTQEETTLKRNETLRSQGMKVYPEVAQGGVTQWRVINFMTSKEIHFLGKTYIFEVKE